MSPRKRSFFRVNRWPSIAASLQLHPHLLPSCGTKHAVRSRQSARKLLLVQPGIRPPPLRAAAAFLAGSPADCPAGSWPIHVVKSKEHPRENLQARRKKHPPTAAQPSNRHERRLETMLKLSAMTLN